MEETRSRFTKRLGIAATIVSLTGGSIALWGQLKPEEELPDLSGQWTIINTVTGSNGGKFDGEVYTYSVGVIEDAAHALSGSGEQTRYQPNGAAEGVAPGHWPITIEAGKHSSEKMVANFTIRGNREFTGTLSLKVNPEDKKKLTGTFSYTAGGTKGTTEVRIE